MEPRWYQIEARDSIWHYYADGGTGNCIVALPTGTGKSVVIADFCKQVLTTYPDQRIIKATHRKELIEQNFNKLCSHWPLAPAGIYSAGLGRRDHSQRLTFCGIASVAKKAELFGHVDLLLVDECHLISPKESTNYRQFIADLKRTNPDLKVIGFTATPYRLGQGTLTSPGGIFTDVCYDLTHYDGFNRLLADGFLCPLIPAKTGAELDVSGVRVQGGEFVQHDLQLAVDKAEITRAALNELVKRGYDRKHWLIFAAGVEHSDHVATMLREYYGVSAVSIHSKMPTASRDKAIYDWQTGLVRCAVNNDILTTGIDFPGIDLIGMLRPTKSPVLWVQALGRGTRPYEGKRNCLVLDFAGNTARLGPINDPVLPRPKGDKGKGDAPVKLCPACGTWNHTRAVYCCSCGHKFVAQVKIQTQASELELIAGDEAKLDWFPVKNVVYSCHYPRVGRRPSLRVTYHTGLRQFSEYVALEHPSGIVRHKARDWWRERTGNEPPDTTEDARRRSEKELATPTQIQVWLNKDYPEVLAYRYE